MEVHKLEPKVKWQQTIIYRSPTTGVTIIIHPNGDIEFKVGNYKVG